MSKEIPKPFEIGYFSFAELTPDPATGQLITPAERIENLLETIELADQVGLDVFALGEHHRPDFVSSAPAVILAAAAARTKQIRLSPAVTVLSSITCGKAASEQLQQHLIFWRHEHVDPEMNRFQIR